MSEFEAPHAEIHTAHALGHADGSTRRDFLYLTAAAIGAVGAAGAGWAFVDSMNPSGDVLALSSIEVDLAPIAKAQAITVSWRGKPVFIRSRTDKEIAEAQNVDLATLPDPEADKDRVQKPQWLIVVGICTHLGCVPAGPENNRPARRVRRLPLPLPRLAIRYLGAHPQRPGAEKPGRAGLQIHVRYQDQDRLSHVTAPTDSALHHKANFKNPAINWVDQRLPVFSFLVKEYGVYPTPRNFNYLYSFGALALFMLVVMIASRRGAGDGIHAQHRLRFRFGRAHHARRQLRLAAALYPRQRRVDVLHRRLYPHVPRACITGRTRSRASCCGCSASSIFLLMMATAFMGYTLPWGQMSFWGATVITNLFSAIPCGRRRDHHLAVGRLCRRQSDAEPVLRAALPDAVRDLRLRLPACLGAAHRGVEQSAWGSSPKATRT